ncbi:hypothetical protein TEA_000220 [Camellia sinensis var. sinensis]|uniref:Pseudouridine synthase RsuA/RluA-like domain-containing protein n=1 Tax=Camellia sinensis var. sinensis TaxID=542762 RepID=A0A4S4DEL0_CAMSN|nr:hypothetical protein TEA_000220 [Camellia sinensis var. sinensis]
MTTRSSALLRRSLPFAAASRSSTTFPQAFHECQSQYTTTATTEAVAETTDDDKKKGKWFTLPPFVSTVDGAALGKELSGRRSERKGDAAATTTALKWVLRCCPQLPRFEENPLTLQQVLIWVLKHMNINLEGYHFTCVLSSLKWLFCLDASTLSICFAYTKKTFHCCFLTILMSATILSRDIYYSKVAAKDSMNLGDQIFLPVTVQEFPSDKPKCFHNEEEMNFLHSLELYKDPAIIVVNKPPGMPVQGGAGIKKSLDELAATYLSYDFPEPPRLVHRLDRDSSGILVMGRTQTSTRVLHSIFREKTFGASNDGLLNRKRILQRKYWALVIGSPRRAAGVISVPLKKVIVDDGKSERITVVDNAEVMSSQHAITEYQVIESSSQAGYTWLELSPLTGRKHQLRVHCAEVLGTPIVGDYKYGWQAHRKMKHLPNPNLEMDPNEQFPKGTRLPLGLDLDKGSILERQPHLHLHCKEMVLPDVSTALYHLQFSSSSDLTSLDSLKLAAPLPSHMEKSWNILNS